MQAEPLREKTSTVSWSEEDRQILLEGNEVKCTMEESYHSTVVDQLTPAPPMIWDRSTLRYCAYLYQAHVAPATGAWIPDEVFIDVPKWLFLEYLVKHQAVVTHGSNNSDIQEFRPWV